MNKRHFPAITGALAVTVTAIPVVLFGGIVWWRNQMDSGRTVSRATEASSSIAVSHDEAEPEKAVSAIRNDDAKQSEIETALSPEESSAVSVREPLATESSIVLSDNPVDVEQESLDMAVELSGDVPGNSTTSEEISTVGDTSSETTSIVKFPAIGSVYQSTGHLALVSQRGEDASSKKKVAQNSKSGGKKSEKSQEMPDPEQPANAEEVDEEKLIEDVLIQTPSVDTPVAQVENLVASTNAKGWPIALVRSDIPEDVWWVQQSVGIQGKSFAARVNFGNRESLSGSAYKLVIVFLDSPEEVRRFRIAKQFEEIPKGVRRSREFDFVRK